MTVATYPIMPNPPGGGRSAFPSEMGPRLARSWQTRRGQDSPKQEPGPERVTRIELEFVAAGQEGRALDLGDHRGPTTDGRLADDPTEERGVDDAPLAERRPPVGSELSRLGEEREPRRRAAATRRPVDFTVGEHGDVALGQA